MGSADVFSVPVFFIVFRECLEASIIVAVLLAFVDRAVATLAPNDRAAVQRTHACRKCNIDPVARLRRRFVRQIWLGAGIGLAICLVLGGAFIGAFYSLQKDIWGKSEDLWEGIFSMIAAVLITIMGLAMLRINRLRGKWQAKLAASFDARMEEVEAAKREARQARLAEMSPYKRFTHRIGHFTKSHAMFILPFVTVLREGLECVVFVGGIGLSTPAKAFPLPVFCGLLTGFFVGYLIYRGNRYVSIEIFLVLSTWILYLVAAGLFSKSIGFFEANQWNKLVGGGDVDEAGSGPGSYNIKWTIWHVNYGNPEIKTSGYGWQVFNAVLGWNNTGTYGTTIGYCLYWVAITLAIVWMRMGERHPTHPVFVAARKAKASLQKLKPWHRSKAATVSSSDVIASSTDREAAIIEEKFAEIDYTIPAAKKVSESQGGCCGGGRCGEKNVKDNHSQSATNNHVPGTTTTLSTYEVEPTPTEEITPAINRV
ncbi:high-affinity iron permease [Savitreella phatthalungensis]